LRQKGHILRHRPLLLTELATMLNEEKRHE
jgi:energy-coupling factor transport system ATP-binding protein